jgi:hypothetical protein
MSPPSSESKSKPTKHETASKPRALLATRFMPISCLAKSSTFKMEATYCSETLTDSQPPTWRNMPETTTLLTVALRTLNLNVS